MERDSPRDAPRAGESPRRKGLITLVGERYPLAGKVQKLAGYEPGGLMRAAFRTLAKAGVGAVPALLGEMEDKNAENRELAARLLRKVVERHQRTDWDCAFPRRPGGWVKEALASLVGDENEEVALNAAGALGIMMKNRPCDGIGAFGERRLSIMELGRGEGPLAKCGAAVRDSMQWLADGEEI